MYSTSIGGGNVVVAVVVICSLTVIGTVTYEVNVWYDMVVWIVVVDGEDEGEGGGGVKGPITK